jgi:hypothetical protein
VVEQFDHRVPETVDIGEDDGLAMPPELRPGQHLDRFLDRADAARQSDESLGPLEHDPLPFMHAVSHDEVRHIVKLNLDLGQKPGNDAGNGTPLRKHGPGDRPHEADRSAAINKTDPRLSHQPAETGCRFHMDRGIPCAGPAIDAKAGKFHGSRNPGRLSFLDRTRFHNGAVIASQADMPG